MAAAHLLIHAVSYYQPGLSWRISAQILQNDVVGNLGVAGRFRLMVIKNFQTVDDAN